MTRYLIVNGMVYTGSELLAPASLIVEGDSIVQILSARGAEEFQPEDGDVVIDASECLVTPGLINAHTHIYSALARGITLGDPAPKNFLQNLERLWWRLDAALTLSDIDLSARLCAVECVHAGVTTVFDHHASQRAIRGSLSTLSRALGSCGLRACLSFEVSDRMGPAAARAGCEENAEFLEEVRAGSGQLRRGLFGLHASFTLSTETLEACVKAASSLPDAGEDPVGFHIHVAEDRIDAEITRNRDEVGVVERLRDFGILGPRTLCVHGVHLEESELAILAQTGCRLAHCPESNMNNAVGTASLVRMRQAGLRTVLGTDGFTADLKREALVAHLLQNHETRDPRTGGREVPGLLFASNGSLAADIFGTSLGRIAAQGPADLVVWDYRPPTPVSAENFWGHLLFGLSCARAEHVFVAGRHVLRRGEVTFCREDELRRRCRDAARRLWERF